MMEFKWQVKDLWHDMLMHTLKFGWTFHMWWILLSKEASKEKVNDTWVYVYMMSQIKKLGYEIELKIQIDKKDFMHDINQWEFKVDG